MMYLYFIATLAKGDGTPFNLIGEVIQLIITLTFVLALAFFTLYFLKRFMRSRSNMANRGSEIKVIEKRMLHQKASVYLVEVMGRGFLIAESAAGVHPIAEFSQEEMEKEKNEIKSAEEPSINFSAKLKEIIKNKSIKTKI